MNYPNAVAEFRGRLYVFVDVPCASESASPIVLYEVFGIAEPGQPRWYLTGWAVGNSARGGYCARTSASKLRAFATFAAAMDFVRKKRKSRPDERFHLVYEVDGRKSIVTSLEQIQRMDESAAGAVSPGQSDAAADPIFDGLAERVGRIVARNALELLRILEQEGEDAARARFSVATYERLSRVLREAGLVDAVPPSTEAAA